MHVDFTEFYTWIKGKVFHVLSRVFAADDVRESVKLSKK